MREKDHTSGWGNNSVRKKFYHRTSDYYQEFIKEDSSSEKTRENDMKKSSFHSFIVPWQMENSSR